LLMYLLVMCDIERYMLLRNLKSTSH